MLTKVYILLSDTDDIVVTDEPCPPLGLLRVLIPVV